MNAEDAVRARHRAYALFGALLQEGPTPERLPVVQALPPLAAVLPAGGPDDWAADHHRALSLAVFPYASVFVGDGLLGGAGAAASRAAFAAGGFHPRGSEPDHAALHLAFLAHLCAAELEAAEAGLTGRRVQIVALQRDFLDVHLLPWVPALAVALARADAPFHATVAELAAELAADHRASLPGPHSVAAPPEKGLDLDDPATGWRDVVRWLALPAASGWFLSRPILARLGATAGVPTGFGSRVQQLETIWRGAADRQVVDLLAGAHLGELEAWEAAFRALAGRGPDVSGWMARLEATRDVLQRVAAALRDRAPGSSATTSTG